MHFGAYLWANNSQKIKKMHIFIKSNLCSNLLFMSKTNSFIILMFFHLIYFHKNFKKKAKNENFFEKICFSKSEWKVVFFVVFFDTNEEKKILEKNLKKINRKFT